MVFNVRFVPIDPAPLGEQVVAAECDDLSAIPRSNILPGYTLQAFLARHIIADWIINARGPHFRWMDYGSGDGFVTSMLQEELEVIGAGINRDVSAVGFEREAHLIVRAVEALMRRRLSTFEIDFTADEERLPTQLDAVLFHFSLHHEASSQDELNALVASLLERFSPRHLALADFDFRGMTDAQVRGVFLSSVAGIGESRRMGDRLVPFHRIFNLDSYLEALRFSGYRPKSIHFPNGEQAHETGAFLIDAERYS